MVPKNKIIALYNYGLSMTWYQIQIYKSSLSKSGDTHIKVIIKQRFPIGGCDP